MTGEAAKPKRMRKPRLCDSCQVSTWPAFGVGCPGPVGDRPDAVRAVYLWHCGAPRCDADLRGRYAARLRDLDRPDLAARVLGETFRPVPVDPAAVPAPASILSPGAALAAARRPAKHRPAPSIDGQASLFGG